MPPLKTSIAMLLFLSCCTLTVQAQTLVYVDHNAPGANNGTTWRNAYLELSTALANAQPDTVIRVADGVYSPGPAREDSFPLKSLVALEGGYAGFGAPDPNARDIALYLTILDGNDYNYHVVVGSDTDQTASIDGFTITGGRADGTYPEDSGGGIFNYRQGSPTISRCTIQHNFADGDGGGIYNREECDLTLTECLIYQNTRNGMFSYLNCDLVMTDCVVRENYGKGMVLNGSAVISDCLFIDNYSNGLIVKGNDDTWVEVTQCEFTRNTTAALGMQYTDCLIDRCTFIDTEGPAISLWNGPSHACEAFIVQCDFLGNTAVAAAGAVNAVYYELHIARCTFIGNTGGSGGAIDYSQTNMDLRSCRFYNNHATSYGGAIYAYTEICEPVHCTFLNNTSDKIEGGGAIYYSSTQPSSAKNCIFWGNQPDQISYPYAGSYSAHHCCVEGGFVGTNNIDEDPLFVDPEEGDIHLTAHSPCINRGDNRDAVPLDIDGDAMPFMGTVDMGADEFIDTHLLASDGFEVPVTGGTVTFDLEAGVENSGRWYLVLGSMSGSIPGLPLPGGLKTLPVNFDNFTQTMVLLLNGPIFSDFLSALNGAGSGTAQLVAPTLNPAKIGKVMTFAYCLDGAPDWDFVSNPVAVEIVP